jgi:hypothetical protein
VREGVLSAFFVRDRWDRESLLLVLFRAKHAGKCPEASRTRL